MGVTGLFPFSVLMLVATRKKEGKKAFEAWLSSEFGESRHFAELAMSLSRWYGQLPRPLQRLLVLKCQHWNLSCLQKLIKVAAEELEGFLHRVEQLIQVKGKLTAVELKAIATQTGSKHNLTLGQPASEEDWELIRKVYQLSDEQLAAVQLEARQQAGLNPDTGEMEVTVDAIIEALKVFGYDLTLILPKPKSKRYNQSQLDEALQQATELAVQQVSAEFEKRIDEKERALVEKDEALMLVQAQFETEKTKKLQLQRELEELKQQLGQSQPKREQEAIASVESKAVQESQETQTNFERSLSPALLEVQSPNNPPNLTLARDGPKLRHQSEAPNSTLNLDPIVSSKQLKLFDEELIKNIPVRIVSENENSREMGQLLGSSNGVGSWQVLLDNKGEKGEQTIGVFELKDLEVKYPSDAEEFKPLLEVLMNDVGLSLKDKKTFQEWENQLLLQNTKGYLQKFSQKRRRAKGFG